MKMLIGLAVTLNLGLGFLLCETTNRFVSGALDQACLTILAAAM